MTEQQDSVVSVTLNGSSEVEVGLRWSPEFGAEIGALLANKLPANPTAQANVSEAARAILARGIPPGSNGSDTGLVVGYVQSGKTLSFTAVMAIARDNGFQLVIVIAGSSAQLADQSQKRIRRDLRIDSDNRRAWAPYHNPRVTEAAGIEGLLDDWRDPNVPHDQRQTIVITVMKQHTHLKNLRDLVTGLNLRGISALVIDDEADQASLNNNAQPNRLQRARESTTYARLMDLRRALPSHTYLQYTATPQAPLLISIIDSLSASWVDVLEPGQGYAGGRTFFGPPRDRRPGALPPERPLQEDRIVRIIPPSEIPSNANAITAIPASLRNAIQLFMVGVAAGLVTGDSIANRSMLVHPSVRTADHQTYMNWINDIFQEWRAVFRLGQDDESFVSAAAEFQDAYTDLAETVGPAMPSFEAIVSRFRQAFNRTEVKEVNRRAGGPPVIIDWGQRYGWILVGGQAMDRGFTVEGLTVTYMPRPLGGGNADTMQQRARFFGYKAPYLGYCRVFLERGVNQAFIDYVEHEEFMRRELIRIAESNEPLEEWPRRFVLDPSLRPCRDSVLRDNYFRAAADVSEWIAPQAYVGGPGAETHNRRVVDAFIGAFAFEPDPGHSERTAAQRHLVTAPFPLRDLVSLLVADFLIRDPAEAAKWTELRALLGMSLERNPDAEAVVYQMSSGSRRLRGVTPTGKVKQFFQGAFPVNQASRGSIYPGDRNIARPDMVTVQIHRLDLREESGRIIAENIPFLAVKLPSTGVLPLVVQDQAAQA